MKLHYEKATDTIRTEKNHCLMSFRTFSDGGSFDAALLKDKEQIIQQITAPETATEREIAQTVVDSGIEDPAITTLKRQRDELVKALNDCLEIVQSEFDNDPEPDDLTSWKRAINQAESALKSVEEKP